MAKGKNLHDRRYRALKIFLDVSEGPFNVESLSRSYGLSARDVEFALKGSRHGK